MDSRRSLTQAIRTSTLLLAHEKTQWMERVPHMTPAAVAQLQSMLSAAAALRWNDRMKHYMQMLTRSSSRQP